MAKQTFTTGQVLLASQLTSLQQTALGGGAASAKVASYTLVAADAGTAISMTNASATTITVNTGLFSAGDTVLIQNLGAGVCTVTAGTATVNTAGSLALAQYEAGVLYFVSASAAVLFDYTQTAAASPLTTKGDIYTRSASADARLAVGTNGQVLTADSAEATGLKFATPSGGTPFATDIAVNGLTVGKGTASVATNTALGVDGLLAITTGSNNTVVGYQAGKALTTGTQNVIVGASAGDVLTGGSNTIVGYNAMPVATSTSSNVVIGHDLMSAFVTGGDGNTVIGEGCFISATSGDYNVAIGQTCLESQTSASYNVAIGNNAGSGTGGGANNIYIGNTIRSSSGADNTMLGPGTGNVNATYSNVTNIGHDATASSTSASNTITLGDSNITSLRCQVTSITSISDERDKKDIEPLNVGLDFINTLKPVSFQWNMRPKLDDEGNVISTGKVDLPDIGFIAQDIVKVEDDLGLADYLQLSYRDNPDALEVSQGRLIPILVKAIQDLTAKVQALENATTKR